MDRRFLPVGKWFYSAPPGTLHLSSCCCVLASIAFVLHLQYKALLLEVSQLLGRRFRVVFAALLGSVLVTTVLPALPASAADTVLDAPLRVNFQTAAATAPSGYLADYGQAYDATRGFGWVAQSNGAPLNLVGNGRERNVVTDKRMDTFMMPQSASRLRALQLSERGRQTFRMAPTRSPLVRVTRATSTREMSSTSKA